VVRRKQTYTVCEDQSCFCFNSSRNMSMAGEWLLDGMTERETWRRATGEAMWATQEHGQNGLLFSYGVWIGLDCAGCGRCSGEGEKKLARAIGGKGD
jgi:hypothetical protein